jgi:long-chain acyl-CoA synthetase
MHPWNNAAEMLDHVHQNYANPTHLNYFHQGKWHAMSTKEVLLEIKYLALGLICLGIKKGECIGLMSLPSPRWTIVNFATILAGAVLVPIFPNISDENFIFEVEQTNIKTLFVWENEPILNFEHHRELFENVINMSYDSTDIFSITYDSVLKLGQIVEKKDPELYLKIEKNIKNNDLAAIVYTSGSTGTPKGVRHTNLSLVRHLFDKPIDITGEKTRYLNLLPLAHIFALTMNIAIFAWGGSVYYWNNSKLFAEACKVVHPTFLVLVPRILEKLYASILVKIQHAGFMKRHLGQWAFDLANEQHSSFYKQLFHPVADKILYCPLREHLGGSIETVISGGASLDPHINHFYQEIGIPIVEGWGLTEACPLTVNRHEYNKIGTVGQALKGVQIKIDSEGEVLVKGTAVMQGYYLAPELTNKVLDEEGWFHTGDKGSLDSEGFLTLKGRLKEMYKTSTGEYVVPVPIEQVICKAPLIDAAMVVAEGKKFASCLLFANRDVLESLKSTHGKSNQSDEEFLNSDFVQHEMSNLFSNLNQHLNNWEQIHAYRFIPYPPTIESGELTPSLKLRREVVMKKYKHLIDAMYLEVVKT